MSISSTRYRLWLLIVFLGGASLLSAAWLLPTTPPTPLQLEAEPLPLLAEPLGLITSIVSNEWDGLIVTERRGRVLNITLSNPSQVELLVDMQAQVWDDYSEYGMYSAAPSPAYTTNHTLYLSFSNTDGDLEIGRYRTDNQSYQVVLVVPQPRIGDFAIDSTHKGGQLAFHDSYLFVSTGDGGARHPPEATPAQDPASLLGKILRIDVETDAPLTYTIPADNPFVGQRATAPEVWAMGLRNPWKFSFDTLTGDMFIADVGDTQFEEINRVPAGTSGQNFGWNCFEGPSSFYDGDYCAGVTFTAPMGSYPTHGVVQGRTNCAVTGGYVLRSVTYPQLQGVYVFGDVCGARLYTLKRGSEEGDLKILYEFPNPQRDLIIALGVHRGTLFVANHAGDIYEMVMR